MIFVARRWVTEEDITTGEQKIFELGVFIEELTVGRFDCLQRHDRHGVRGLHSLHEWLHLRFDGLYRHERHGVLG